MRILPGVAFALSALLPLNMPNVLAADPPNVVLIISDDQGWGDFGFMGHPTIRTPNIDRLAGESVVFTNGYVPISLCRPSLATMLTGVYPHQHKVCWNDPPDRNRRNEVLHLIGNAPTFPRLLSAAGYASLQTGKFWEGRYSNAGFTDGMSLNEVHGRHGDAGLKIGRDTMQPIFDFIEAAMRGRDARETEHRRDAGATPDRRDAGATPDGRDAGATPDRRDAGATPAAAQGQDTRATADGQDAHATESGQGGSGGRKPFLVWYAPMLPHNPHNPPERLLSKYRAEGRPVELAKYWAMCEWFDETCGQLLDYLDRKGLRDNTIVMLVVDNGWIQHIPGKTALPEHARGHGFAARSKLSPYDGGLRTPILIRWPGHVKPQRREDLVSTLDLAPTILNACGVKPAEAMKGMNLIDLAAGKVKPHDAVFGEVHLHAAVEVDRPETSLTHRWVREGDWKLIWPKEGEPELYNVRDDPHEEKNLAAGHADRIAALKQRLDAWWTPGK